MEGDADLEPIAIIGMSCRLPGDASTPGDFWKLMTKGRSCWSKIPSNRFNAEAYHHPNPEKKGTMNSEGGYFLSQDFQMFDSGFFDMTKEEAETLDPTQRLLLECSYEALENAGLPKERVAGRKVGVFIGLPDMEHRMGNLRDLDDVPMFDPTGAQGAFLAGRIAYYFDLRGPTLAIDTACSSSMQALHLAVQSIRNGESDEAIVGASHLISQPDVWVSMAKLRLFSESGKTHAFDHRAKSGYARGEGVGCLVLKPLNQAVADNDPIRAVIAQTGISHNGRTVGIVAPSVEEQERLISRVLKEARVDPKDIAFFEAHGTGTKVGDPIEATAIYRAVGKSLTSRDPLYLGSVKSNIGHLENASGIVSVIKAALMLEKSFIVPNADFESANPAIPLAKWNMRIPKTQRPWPPNKEFVCVNNFGYSGSNGHAILRSAPKRTAVEYFAAATDTERIMAKRLFVLSANDEMAVRKSMEKLGIFLEQHAELYQTTMPRNLAYTLCQRRSHMPWRVALVANMCSALALALNSHHAVPRRMPARSPRLAFVFTGQGAQWHAMGRELLTSHPIFASAIEKADRHLSSIGADFSVREELGRGETESLVGRAHISQPICSAVQIALVDLLASWGIKPCAVTGHSSGEIAAAYAAGALTLESAMSAAYYRGQAIISLTENHPNLRGAMMAVGTGAEACRNLLELLRQPEGAVAACENSPESTTVSGDAKAIDELACILQKMDIFSRKLLVDVAYHSPHMRLIAQSYYEAIAGIQLLDSKSNIDFFSALRGCKIAINELGPQYWVENLTQPVRFATALDALCQESQPDILIEVGPHAALKGPIMQTLKQRGRRATNSKVPSYLPTLVRARHATETCLELAAQLFMHGYDDLNFFSINHERAEVETPEVISVLYSYPWSRQRCWYESRISRQHRLKPFARHDLLGTLADWSSDLEPTWRNIIRLDDLPWLRDSRVREHIVYPASAYLSMVVEAASQRATLMGVEEVCVFDIQDVQIKEQLLLEDVDGVEVVLSIRRSTERGTARDEFHISSFEQRRGWRENCQGWVEAKPIGAQRPKVGCFQHRLRVASAPADSISGAHFYLNMASQGMTYPRGFMNIVAVSVNEQGAVAQACVQDTRLDMPMGHETPYLVHPAVLHSMIQIADSDIGLGGTGTPRLVSAFHHVRVQLDDTCKRGPGSRFTLQSTKATKPESFLIELFNTHSAESPVISMLGIEHSTYAAPKVEPLNPRELCFRIEWEPASDLQVSEHPTVSMQRIVVVTDRSPDDELVSSLLAKIESRTSLRSEVSPLSEIRDFNAFFVVLAELDRCQLSSGAITLHEWKTVQRLVARSAGVLWVTCGASKVPTNPDANMILGLLRSARSELACTAATLDLDPREPNSNRQAELIRETMERIMYSKDLLDAEFAEHEGNLVVPRLAVDADMNLGVHRELGSPSPYLQSYQQSDRQLCLTLETPGCIDSLYFDDMLIEQTLGDYDVEIAIMATELTGDDIAAAMTDSTSVPTVARSCSGVVSRVGPKVNNLSVYDRVCVLAEGSLRTHVHVRHTSPVLIPHDMDFSTAALLPLVYCTAWYSLVTVAQIQRGEHVLIQLNGECGLAAIHIAQSLGAEVFVAAKPSEKSEAALASCGVSTDRVFDVSSMYFSRGISAASNGRGMDIVFTSTNASWSARDLERTWATATPFGRVVHARGASDTQYRRVTNATFSENGTFASVSMLKMAATRAHIVSNALRDVMEWFMQEKSSKPNNRVLVLPMAKLKDGLLLVQQQMPGYVVVISQSNDLVKISHPPASCKLNANGAHIIVGGTGGLGRSMARWMVGRGARHIVLVSRSGSQDVRVQHLLDEMHGRAVVKVIICDVADSEQVTRLVNTCAKTMPPICGVVHAAMALHDGLFEELTYDAYLSTVRAKVTGAWNIHNALEAIGAQLDYFVLFSSAAGILGSRGQAAYAAASTFLDSFAAFRRNRGLPGVSLDLTAVTGAGYIAENAARTGDILKNFGGETVSETEVLALLGLAISGTSPHQCLTGLKLSPNPSGDFPYYADDPRFVYLKAAAMAERTPTPSADSSKPVSFGAAFRSAKDEAEAREIAVQGVLQKLSEVMSVGLQDVDAARSMTSYGLDSVTAIEVRNWIARELRANLQILELLTSGCVNDLAMLIVSRTKT